LYVKFGVKTLTIYDIGICCQECSSEAY